MTAKQWRYSKTILLNAITVALATLESQVGLVRDHFGSEAYLGIVVGLAAVNAALRFVTSQPIR